MEKKVIVIGAGLAGSEAAWQLAKRGVKVDLYEMRPKKMPPAHKTQNFGELVCSNSLRANNITNAVGLLKEEMRMLDSIIIKCADATQVPAGGALAVDRDKFSEMITETIKNHPNINVIGEELPQIHLGTSSYQMEKKGIKTERGNHNRKIIALNTEFKKLKE